MAKSKRFADGGMVESTRDRMYREAMAAKTTAPTATPMLSAPLAAAPAPQLDEETEIRMGLQRDGFSRGSYASGGRVEGPGTVKAMGLPMLNAMKDATHTPVKMADGGALPQLELAKPPSSFPPRISAPIATAEGQAAAGFRAAQAAKIAGAIAPAAEAVAPVAATTILGGISRALPYAGAAATGFEAGKSLGQSETGQDMGIAFRESRLGQFLGMSPPKYQQAPSPQAPAVPAAPPAPVAPVAAPKTVAPFQPQLGGPNTTQDLVTEARNAMATQGIGGAAYAKQLFRAAGVVNQENASSVAGQYHLQGILDDAHKQAEINKSIQESYKPIMGGPLGTDFTGAFTSKGGKPSFIPAADLQPQLTSAQILAKSRLDPGNKKFTDAELLAHYNTKYGK
jgi:hypothetical protein